MNKLLLDMIHSHFFFFDNTVTLPYLPPPTLFTVGYTVLSNMLGKQTKSMMLHISALSVCYKRSSHYGIWQKTFPCCQGRQQNHARSWRTLARYAQEMENNSRKNQQDEIWSTNEGPFMHFSLGFKKLISLILLERQQNKSPYQNQANQEWK